MSIALRRPQCCGLEGASAWAGTAATVGGRQLVSRGNSPRANQMMRYAPQTVGVLRTLLVGLDPDMPVEIEPGILLAAKNVADLRALTAWPPDLRLIRPGEPRLPEGGVTVQRALPPPAAFRRRGRLRRLKKKMA